MQAYRKTLDKFRSAKSGSPDFVAQKGSPYEARRTGSSKASPGAQPPPPPRGATSQAPTVTPKTSRNDIRFQPASSDKAAAAFEETLPVGSAPPTGAAGAAPASTPPVEPTLAGERAMNLVFVGSECAPWSKTGGLGDVMGALPKAMARRGHRVMVRSLRLPCVPGVVIFVFCYFA